MKRTIAFLAALAVCAVCSVYGDYRVSNKGTWPKTWPKELEKLRKQSRTLVGNIILLRHYEIPFTKREDFEAAWPHILKVKSKGAPVFLVGAPKKGFFHVEPAGVFIQSPPADADQANPEEPLPVAWPDVRTRWSWRNTTFIELVVDGNIVDLNRIPLPADTPIIDERFQDR